MSNVQLITLEFRQRNNKQLMSQCKCHHNKVWLSNWASTLTDIVKRMPPPWKCIWSCYDLDLWPWKPVQQCPLTWCTFVPSSIKIPPLCTETLNHSKDVMTYNAWTQNGWLDRRLRNIMPPSTTVGIGIKINQLKNSNNSLAIMAHTDSNRGYSRVTFIWCTAECANIAHRPDDFPQQTRQTFVDGPNVCIDFGVNIGPVTGRWWSNKSTICLWYDRLTYVPRSHCSVTALTRSTIKRPHAIRIHVF